MSEKELICSFCGLSKVQTNLLVAGQEAHICDTCIEQAYGIVVEEAKKNETEVSTEKPKIAKPKEIRFGDNLPKTRSGKIMRRLLRLLANGEEITQDISTLENPAILEQLKKSTLYDMRT